MLEKCNLCPNNCNIDRNTQLGKCNCGIMPKIALSTIHMWEEPCISGEKGSGAIFFSGCNLNCIYCQNYKISAENYGKEISITHLAEIFIELQGKGVNNINLVSPTPYVPQIIESIKIAKKNGLHIPIIYNTNAYENIETIKMLEGYIDVYLPDLKYYYNNIGEELSGCANYFEIATNAIKEMYRQVGTPVFSRNKLIQKGLIIRHLCLPGYISNTKKVLEWINENLPKNYVSLMAQYFPAYKAKEHPIINRKLNKKEYTLIKKYSKTIQNRLYSRTIPM